MKDFENMKEKIKDSIENAMDIIFMKHQENLGIKTGDCDPITAHLYSEKIEELAGIAVSILKSQWEDQCNLCGFVWSHGDKDLSAWQVDLSEEDATTIEGILEKYTDKGCSVRNCYNSKFSEVF